MKRPRFEPEIIKAEGTYYQTSNADPILRLINPVENKYATDYHDVTKLFVEDLRAKNAEREARRAKHKRERQARRRNR